MRALVVEDININRQIIRHALSGYCSLDCAEAISGEQAIWAFREAWKEGSPFDLICLDIGLPDMSGIEVLQEIRRMEDGMMNLDDRRRVSILMITASRKDTEVAFDIGIQGYLMKPLDTNKLIELVRNCELGKRAQ